MIEIKNAASDRAAAYATFCGVQADCVMEMTERGESLGFSCFDVNDGVARLVWLEAPDTALVDALLRATLNNARAMGAETALIAHDSLQNHMKNKGYFDSEQEMQVKIADFFSKTACKG